MITKNTQIQHIKASENLINNIKLLIICSDCKGGVRYVSPAVEELLGYKNTELLGDNWWELTSFSQEEATLYKNNIQDFCKNGTPTPKVPYDKKMRCKDGNYKWIEWHDCVNEDGLFYSFGFDISYWKKKEVDLGQSDFILKNIDSMIFVSDSQHAIIYASRAVERVLGYSVNEITGNKWWDITYDSKEEAEKVKNALHKFLFLDQNTGIDISKRRIKTKSGDYKWIEWQVSKGINNTYISIGNDITARIKSDLELKKAKEAAEESVKAKNEFLANMSHEIRTPLNAIIGFTDLLLETNLSYEQKMHLQTMRNSGEILLSLINNVLDISKLEANKVDIEKIPYNLNQKLHDLVKLMKIKADEKNISLKLSIDPNLPNEFIGDPNRLGQILINLIGNAVKFTNEGFVYVKVSLINETKNMCNVLFEIKDTGIGIVSNKINTVFGAFTQAKSDTSRIYGGTGLGLAIVKRLVILLKGEIKVESKFGEGSNFKLELPLEKNIISSIAEEKEIKVNIDIPLNLDILLVEDNTTNQLLAKTRLERWNCTVDIANNGIEAVKKVEQHTYDCILMDIQMPVMDGYEATKIIKNDLNPRAAKIPIVAMTAYTQKSEVDRIFKEGMDDYLFKPFKPEVLYKILLKQGEISKDLKKTDLAQSLSTFERGETKKYTDLKFLKSETANDRTLLTLLINSFLLEIIEYISILKKEIKSQNAEVLYKATHKIKPSIAMFGIGKLEATIYKLEKVFKECKFSEATQKMVQNSIAILEKVQKELQEELKLLKNG